MSDDDLAALCTLQEGFVNRPKNTNLSYNRKAREFSDWCREVGYPDGATVTGAKLHRFLKDKVCSRCNRKDKGKIVGFLTVRQYKSAIIDLYTQQKGMNMNTNEHPGLFPAVKSLMVQYKSGTNSRNHRNYADRAQGTILAGFTTNEDLIKMSKYYLDLNRPLAIRNRLLYLLPHFTLCRGENVRALQLADLFFVKLDNEGYSTCHAVVAVMSQGKRNQFGKKESGAFIRNKNVVLCPIGALALYLFVRFHIQNAPFPTFNRNSDWYDIMLTPADNPVKPIHYSTHYKIVKDMLDSLRIKSNVKTHMGRGSGAKMADVLGASEPDIRRSGRWNQQAVNCYLTSLPRETMRTLAGFPKDRGHFYIPRQMVEPPLSLTEQIFPEVSRWLAIHGMDFDSEPDADANVEHSMATDGFLMLMKLLRTILLQDSVFLQDIYPNLFIWQHPLFSTVEYKAFAKQLKSTIASSGIPEEERLAQSVPLIADRLANLSEILHDHHNVINNKLDSQLRTHSLLEEKINNIFSGRSALRIVADSFTPCSSPNAIIPERNHEVTQNVHAEVPKYTLSRSLHTVAEVWMEYVRGIGNNPSVKELELKYGAKWRREPKEQRFFSRRKNIYRKVEQLVDQGLSEVDAVNTLEEERILHKLSLDALQKRLNK